MTSHARFEIVRGDAGWFARFLAANNRQVWRTSETYKRRAGAQNAIDSLAAVFHANVTPDGKGVTTGGWAAAAGAAADIGYVDEREAAVPVEVES